MNDLRFAILSLIANNGLTLASLARRAKCSPNTFYALMRGDSDSLNHSTLEKIASGMGCAVSQILSSTPTSFGARVCVERSIRGWTQEDLAQKLNVAQASVCRWEKHGVMPGADEVIRLARLFGVKPADLVYGAERPAEIDATPTPALRWQLQQLYTSNTGAEMWRDVPGATKPEQPTPADVRM